MAQEALVGHDLLIIEATLLHSDTPHSVELLWTSDQPEADLYLTIHSKHKRQTSLPLAGFEPAIPACERKHTRRLRTFHDIRVNKEP